MSILNHFSDDKPNKQHSVSHKETQKFKLETKESDKRTIRVFISSTFRDMKEERDALMTHCWPELRRFCRERQVELVEVDLRWGIAEEQSTRKETLKLCLDEIRACRPFFIGLLGERYGWIPEEDAFTADLKEEQPWLKNINGKSVTELEILHGVLNNPEMAGRAFFYFRDPKYIETIPKEKKADFLSETHAGAEKQAELKALIRKTCTEKNIPLKETYNDPHSLAVFVLEQLKDAINPHFPIEEIPDMLIREAREHEIFAESRRRTYIGRPEYFNALNKHCSEDEKPLILLGDSGSGKSALLANWIDLWRKAQPSDFIFQHYIGGTPDSAVHWNLMKRLMADIKRWSDDPDEIPISNDDIIRDFPFWLSKARLNAENKGVRFIIVMDALNQLEDKDRGRLLGWLPIHHFTGAIRLIVSTLPGDTFEVLKKRALPTLRIQPLKTDERRRLIVEYLARFSKTLDIMRLDRISAEPAAANPLYLKILLDELRVTGTHERLDERLDEYLAAKDIPALLGKVLVRYQHDYEHDRKGLVSEALGLIWAARRGLTEVELLQLLKPRFLSQLPLATWAPLRYALEEGLLDRGGILNFGHNFIRTAVETAFLPDLNKKDDFRIQLADYFENLTPDARNCDELPWLLRKTESLERLRKCLLNIDCFLEICNQNQDELRSYWVYLKEEKTMGKPYLDSFYTWLENKETNDIQTSDAANQLGLFLYDAALYTEAEPLYQFALHTDENIFGKEHPNVAVSLHNLAQLFLTTEHFNDAELLMLRVLKIDEDNFGSDHPNVASSLNSLSLLYEATNRKNESELLMRRVLKIDEGNLGKNHPTVANRLNNLAMLLKDSDRMKEAEHLMRRALQIDEDCYGKTHSTVARDLNNLSILLQTSRKKEAELLIRRALEINEMNFGEDHPNVARDLNNLSTLLYDTNRFIETEPLLRRALKINELSFGMNHTSVASCLNNLSQLLRSSNRVAEAIPLMERSLGIIEVNLEKDHPKVAEHLNNLTTMLYNVGRMSEAEPLMRRALKIDEQNYGKDHVKVINSLFNLAKLLQAVNNMNEALPLSLRIVEIVITDTRISGHKNPHLEAAVNNYAGLLKKMGFTMDKIFAQVQQIAPEYFNQTQNELQNEKNKSPQQIRNLALELYKNGNYEEAKKELDILLTLGFEVLSTHIHLTRVSILLNQMENADEHLEMAWQKRTEAPNYVVPRMIWFKLALAVIYNSTTDKLLGMLKMVLQNDDAFMEWTMNPVLEHIKPQISEHQHALLSALVDAMSNKTNLEKLNDFDEWRVA